ncbi:MAG: hypothetical protein LAT76_05585 [Schleiferiaceae bacterium]|nr:hypothetical protein [Schleiferiaceae bacterium]
MDETLKNEISNLCNEILSHPGDQTLGNLIEKLELLQEKLLMRDFLRVREARFLRITKRLEEQLQTAISANPLERNIPQMAASELEMVTAAVEHISESPKQANPSVKEEEVIDVLPPEPVVKTEQPLLFEPTPQEEPVPPTPEPEAKKPVEPRFIPNPKPTITGKREAPTTQTAEINVETAAEKITPKPTSSPKPSLGDGSAPRASLNDRLNKNINIGLNDRIAFVKHLFGGSQEDFNRVISQLNTMTTFDDAQNFILNFVKPDYNWNNKEEYEERLFEIVTKRFEN